MIRTATPSDTQDLVKIATRLASEFYPGLRPDHSAIRQTVTGCIASPSSFVRVSLDGDRVVGGLIAFTERGGWFERAVCRVGLLYTTVAGDGAAMLRELRRWVERRPAIKAVQIVVDFNEPERVGLLLSRVGFPRLGVVHGIAR